MFKALADPGGGGRPGRGPPYFWAEHSDEVSFLCGKVPPNCIFKQINAKIFSTTWKICIVYSYFNNIFHLKLKPGCFGPRNCQQGKAQFPPHYIAPLIFFRIFTTTREGGGISKTILLSKHQNIFWWAKQSEGWASCFMLEGALRVHNCILQHRPGHTRTGWKVEEEINIWKGKTSSFSSDFPKAPIPCYLRIEHDVEEYCPEMGIKSDEVILQPL